MMSFVTQCQEGLLSNQSVMDYLINSRHMTRESIQSSMIGYYPVNAKMKFESNDSPDLFRLKGRVVVPIFSEFNDVVGFAGRFPDPNVKGWWNTSFPKTSHLYGFNEARQKIFEENKAYIFEGYFDRIVLAQFGLKNCVAAMSANLGMRRLGLLARYCDRVCLCFDTDHNDSGLLGSLKTLADMYSIGIGLQPSSWKVTMIKLPVKVDPDEFVAQNGLDAFLALEKELTEEQLCGAKSAYELLKDRLREKQQRSK